MIARFILIWVTLPLYSLLAQEITMTPIARGVCAWRFGSTQLRTRVGDIYRDDDRLP